MASRTSSAMVGEQPSFVHAGCLVVLSEISPGKRMRLLEMKNYHGGKKKRGK